jgi:DUF4097 and DUF4098 domain-containing protein YvlB
MKRAFGVLALAVFTGVSYGQMRDNRDNQLSCDANRRNGAGSCEIRESTLGPSGSLQIEPGHNGSIIVKGWSQNSVRVRARVETWAPSDAGARNLTAQVHVDAGAGLIRATGPEYSGFLATGDEGWSVSFEVFAPWSTDLKLESHNGTITISDIRGRIAFQTHNGSIHLARIAGDVSGETHNGAIQAELQGNTWEGRQLELSTYNGGITLSMSASYSASLQTETSRGKILSDLPVTLTGRMDSSKRNFNIGAGGPLIKVSTHNGSITLKSM